MVKSYKIGLFPGRFQPFTNSHLERIIEITHSFPTMKLCILLGDMGTLNFENFLTVEEREKIIEAICKTHFLKNVFIRAVKGAYPPEKWAESVRYAIPDAEIVFSDNPFVYEPLAKAGLEYRTHCRKGIDGADLRALPFQRWKEYIPQEEFDFLCKNRIHERLQTLSESGKYPFLRREGEE